MSRLVTQIRAELPLVARNGEQLLLTLVIPVMLLVFFSLVDVLPTGTDHPVDFLAPGVLALAVMSAAMVSLGIATGFERSYHVLKRLGATPLGRTRLIAAKIAAVAVVEVVQFAILIPIAYALGWRPTDARWLLTSSLDGALRVFDLPSGTLLQALRLGEAPVTAFALAPDTAFLATAHRGQRCVPHSPSSSSSSSPPTLIPSMGPSPPRWFIFGRTAPREFR